MSTSLPTSWQYGSFYADNRMYSSKPNQSCDFSDHKMPAEDPKLTSEDYFRVLNEYKKIDSKNHESLNIENESTINYTERENTVEVPRETMYMIDRMVRQRTSRAKLALHPNPHQFSEEKKQRSNEEKPVTESLNIDYTEKDYINSTSRKSKSHRLRDVSDNKSQKTFMTYEEWYRLKEVERKLKDRLVQDAKVDCKELKEKFDNQEEEEKQYRKKLVEDWMKIKKKESKMKKKQKHKKKQQEKQQKKQRKELAQKAFREWLKDSLRKDKKEIEEQYKRRQRIMEREITKRMKAKRKIEAEICYKKWKLNKDKELRHKRKQKQISQHKDTDQIESRIRRYRGEILLAYSNLSKCNEQVKQYQRPKTAKVRRKY
ncbi:unnamed protein product [Moneuplotes crassus]|uniref:Uncharacterized protein n=1 Tax=Euplotes crassus TaxID=5936 RepID=A0AAD1US70_EUPCR|nr:unnamed protein product [Moneuplotes crassus]